MKLLIRRLRNNLKWLGYDFGHLSDEEFARRFERAGRVMARAANEAAVTVEQMGNALKRMAAAYNSTQQSP